MKLPKPKFKIGDKVIVDNFDNAVIKRAGVFRKNEKIFVAYELDEGILLGFWAEENRLKLKKDELSKN